MGQSNIGMNANPIQEFRAWYAAAVDSKKIMDPTAMVVASGKPDGSVDARVVLLKQVTDAGFYFVSNYQSSKARDFEANAHVAVVFHWDALEQQIRIRGRIAKAEAEFSDNYFQSRSRDSQLGAWASAQSHVIPDRDALSHALTEVRDRFEYQPVPRPPHWGGYCIQPDAIEFWLGQPHRLHDRFLYSRVGDSWTCARLSP
jgi:pyridoxamine 5'-phosphate oxidase